MPFSLSPNPVSSIGLSNKMLFVSNLCTGIYCMCLAQGKGEGGRECNIVSRAYVGITAVDHCRLFLVILLLIPLNVWDKRTSQCIGSKMNICYHFFYFYLVFVLLFLFSDVLI